MANAIRHDCQPCRRQRHPPQPRLLYGSIFTWISIVGGRFMAPFLKHEAHFADDAMIGLVVAIGTGVTTLVAPSCGSIADQYEVQKPLKGRTQILMIGVILGSLAFILHGMQHIFPHISFWQSTSWHFALRIVYAIASAVTFPVLDGIALAHIARKDCARNGGEYQQNEVQTTNSEEENTSSYGKERLHGAIWWAITNLILGPCLDRWGFQVLYGFAVVSTIVCLWSISYYTAGQQYQNFDYTLPDHQQDEEDDENQYGDNDDISYDDDTFNDNDGNQLAQVPTAKTISSLGDGSIENTTTIDATETTKVPMTALLRMMCGTFYGSPMLLEKLGPGALQIVAGAAYVIRVVGYTLVPKGHMVFVFLLEPMHGVTYACAKTSSVEFVSTLMPTGYEASGQALLGLFGGLGSITGLLLGGWMEEHLDPRIMYRSLALVVSIGMAIFLIASTTRQSPSSTVSSVSYSKTTTQSQIDPIFQCDDGSNSNDDNFMDDKEPRKVSAIELT